MLTKTKLDRCQRARPETILQEAIGNHIEKDALPKEIKETLLNELKEILLLYWSNTSENIVTVPSMDAAELALKLICLWSEEASSKKEAGASNVCLMETLQTLCTEMDAEKEEITRLTKLTPSDLGKGGEINPKLEAVLEEKEQLAAKLKRVQDELNGLGDARLMLNGAKLQIRGGEVEIARLTDALREATKKN